MRISVGEDARSSFARGVTLAIWTWAVFSVIAGLALARLGSQMPERATVPATFGDAFVAVLTLDLGKSILFQESAMAVAFDGFARTAALLVATLLLTAVFSAGLVALSRRGETERRVATGLSYLGGLPVMLPLLGLFWLDRITGPPLGVQSPAEGVLGIVPGAVALSVPLAAVAGRLVVRDARRLDWVVDGWLFTSWLLGTVMLVESFFRIRGVGDVLFVALTNSDYPLVFASMLTLLLVALLASVLRELAWSRVTGPCLADGTDDELSAQADGGGPAIDPRRAFRENRRVRVGLTGFTTLFAVAVVGMLLDATDVIGNSDPAARVGPPLAEWTMLVLVEVLPAGFLAGVVAAVVGVVIGLVSVRASRGLAVSAIGIGFAMNVPLYLWLVLLSLSWTGPGGIGVAGGPAQVLIGVSLAPIVGVVAARDLPTDGSVSLERLLPALGTAAVGAGVATLVFGYSTGLIGASPAQGPFAAVVNDTLAKRVVRLGVGVGFPAVALFVLGDGLREVGADT